MNIIYNSKVDSCSGVSDKLTGIPKNYTIAQRQVSQILTKKKSGAQTPAPQLTNPAPGQSSGDNFNQISALVSGGSAPALSFVEAAIEAASVTSTVTASNTSTASAPLYGKSKNHDPQKFVPSYSIMAYWESGIYRTASDPYAVGAITNPSKKQDLGGKTYGTYQFESYVYRGGTKGTNRQLRNSTLMRFLRWSGNPYGAQLKTVADTHGIASSQFDEAWKQLAKDSNQAFGQVQEAFLLHDKKAKVDAFLSEAEVSDEVKNDPRIFDLVLGTKNHVDSLSNSIPGYLARRQKELGRKMTPNEVGEAITWFKGTRVKSWFRSSPKAHDGVRNRFKAEGKIFDS